MPASRNACCRNDPHGERLTMNQNLHKNARTTPLIRQELRESTNYIATDIGGHVVNSSGDYFGKIMKNRSIAQFVFLVLITICDAKYTFGKNIQDLDWRPWNEWDLATRLYAPIDSTIESQKDVMIARGQLHPALPPFLFILRWASDWCGTRGCSLSVLKPTVQSESIYEPFQEWIASEIQIRTDITINGWYPIVLNGDTLAYDGSKYTLRESEWFAVNKYTGACVVSDGPAKFIQNHKMLGLPYIAKDVKDNGVVVETTKHSSALDSQMTFYRSGSRCDAAVETKAINDKKELDKYD